MQPPTRAQSAVVKRRVSSDFFEALQRYDQGELTEAGPAGCDSDKCLLASGQAGELNWDHVPINGWVSCGTPGTLWRGGRVVYGSGLENQRVFTGTVGSNPTLSVFTKLETTVSTIVRFRMNQRMLCGRR